MKLRWRLLLFFLIAAFVPLSALGWLVRSSLVERIEEEHRRQLATRVESAGRRIKELTAADRRSVDALCEHDGVVDALLLDLATGRFGPATEQQLVRELPPLMRGRRFEALLLLDAGAGPTRGRILGSGHYPDQVGGQADLVDAVARLGREPYVAEVRVRDESGAGRYERELMAGCVVARDGAAVAVIAGRVLGDAFAESLLGDVSPVSLGLSDSDKVPGDAESITSFSDAYGDPALTLYATIDDAPLQREIALLQQRSYYVALAALVLASLLAIGFTLTLARPLAQLEEAARRVASGDLESQIEVRRRDEIGSAMLAFNDMTQQLASTRQKLLRAERIAAWREVARRIAHEIKNPLQPIQMEIETMQKLHARKHPSFDEEFSASTDLVLEEVRRLDAMVTEFSRFARLPRPKTETLDLRAVVRHVEGLCAHDPELEVILPTEPVTIRGDREQLTQVLLNLVQNALDASRARHGSEGTVRVELDADLSSEEPGGRIVVDDDGPGIEPADRLKVFEPYFTTKAKGTGLGLAIVHRIVGDHGGSIDVGEGIDGGSSFVVLLPQQGPPAAVEASLTDESLPLGRP